eukprot:109723-Rhodomonas_salina.2
MIVIIIVVVRHHRSKFPTLPATFSPNIGNTLHASASAQNRIKPETAAPSLDLNTPSIQTKTTQGLSNDSRQPQQ